MKRVLEAFAANSVFANICLLLIFFAGGLATLSMIRESFPEFSVDKISITVAYPGADPEEVEEGISRKIEETLESVEGIKQVVTTSAENRASVIVEVKDGHGVDEVLDQLKSRINAISTFPLDAEKPVIREIIHKEVVVLLALSGNLSEKQLKEWGERVKDEVKLIPAVSQVETYGTRDYEISIELSEQRLKEYGLTLGEVAEAVRRSSVNLAGGTLRTSGEEIRIRTVGRKYTGEELAGVVILARP
ncbi:MAG: efflux RND transporter permease subunit, partial [Thermodesulfobacteriota bacterium]